MRVLFTGASSFTGAWFVQALAQAGHSVTTTMTRCDADAYSSDHLRRQRVDLVTGYAERVVWDTAFGDERFLDLARSGFDLIAHHGANVTDYKNPDFDVVGALGSNTHNLRAVLGAFADAGGGRVLLTGSVFEGDEGAGDGGLPHFSAYGLSKALTAQVFRHACHEKGLHLGKLVIPNPFGPLEEPRFTAYLMKTWFAGKAAGVNTPDYIRDNIHIDLLAGCYAAFAASLPDTPGFTKMAPSGYIESQGAFATRLSAEMRKRLDLACELNLATQTDFAEPMIRINTEPATGIVPGWSQQDAWDGFAEYYKAKLAGVNA